jgi:high-affinity Fe2+/Pb2+ permease
MFMFYFSKNLYRMIVEELHRKFHYKKANGIVAFLFLLIFLSFFFLHEKSTLTLDTPFFSSKEMWYLCVNIY